MRAPADLAAAAAELRAAAHDGDGAPPTTADSTRADLSSRAGERPALDERVLAGGDERRAPSPRRDHLFTEASPAEIGDASTSAGSDGGAVAAASVAPRAACAWATVAAASTPLDFGRIAQSLPTAATRAAIAPRSELAAVLAAADAADAAALAAALGASAALAAAADTACAAAARAPTASGIATDATAGAGDACAANAGQCNALAHCREGQSDAGALAPLQSEGADALALARDELDERQCAICLREVAEAELALVAVCDHPFCLECILRWYGWPMAARRLG
jgi:hypothetical protein